MQPELRPGVLAVNNSRPVRGRNKTPDEMAYGLSLMERGMSVRTAAAKAGVNYRTLHVWSKRRNIGGHRVPADWVREAYLEAARVLGHAERGETLWSSSTALARLNGRCV